MLPFAIPVRFYAYAGIVLAVMAAGGGLYLKGRSAGKASGEAIAAEAVRERDQAKAALEAAERAAEVAREASKGYQDEIDRLRTVKPARPVRLCVSPGVPPATSASAGPDASGTPGGQLPPSAGPDIGPSLYSEADRADELAAQLRALQGWLQAVQ